MSSWFSVLAGAKRRLADAGIDDAETDAWLLMEHATGIDRARYLLKMTQEMDQEKEEQYASLIDARLTRRPLQQITGTQEFMGFPFSVNEHVLIPRQDTETLVETALAAIRQREGEAIQAPLQKESDVAVLDLCTGSGCIGISIAKLTSARVTCSDISAQALAIAKKNAEKLDAHVTFAEGDLFAGVSGLRFDFIVSNPPYIRTDEIDRLMPEVRVYEPRLALDGAHDGLSFYRRIAREATDFLNPGGGLLMEIGCDQGQAVSELLREQGYCEIEVIKDIAGLDRVVRARFIR